MGRIRHSFLLTVCYLLWQFVACDENNADETIMECLNPNESASSRLVPDSCRVVLAPTSQSDGSNLDWRIYSLVDSERGRPVVPYGDIVIQLSDLEDEAIQSSPLLLDHLWDGQETGGQYEGKRRVDSLVPGLGMMARSFSQKEGRGRSNLLPFAPRVDEGGLTRQESPGGGAITHYHNYTIFYSKPVQAGEELILYSVAKRKQTLQDEPETEAPHIFDLLQSGYCLDNLRPKKSRIKHAGRGAVATRDLPKGSIVAPVPVLPISRSVLETKDSKQLLLNYCYGHSNSTTLLFPYGPIVNLINHYSEPNVQLQWYNQIPVDQIETSSSDLMMELVAIKDIQKGDEIYMDYGRDWEDAWWKHVKQWQPPVTAEHYSPGYVIDDTIRMLRTEAEQKDHPYPTNVETSCFYRYSDRTDDEKSTTTDDKNKVQTFQWKLTKGLYDLKNLRPCKVLKRNESSKGRSAYAVRMLNRPGLEDKELIPKGQMHIITGIPRAAVRITDKAKTTDQHLPGAFRHEIHLKDDLFPQSWLNQ